MNLIKWENNRIIIAPEAYSIAVFKKIWDADKTKGKTKAVTQLSMIYFMYDPRSEYQFETDEALRLATIKEHMGIPKSWKPDKDFLEAIPVYNYLTNTTSAKALAGNRKALNKVDDFIDEVTVTENNMDKILKAVDLKNDLAVRIAKAEQEIYKDVEEHSVKMRGRGVKSIGDDGLSELFNEDID